MRVRIISSQPDTWYIDKIGSEYTITDFKEIVGANDQKYMVAEANGGIFCCDFISIDEEQYPTLAEKYFK